MKINKIVSHSLFSLITLLCMLLASPGRSSAATVDGLGRTLNLTQSPERIVVLGYSELDSLLALGAGDLIVGGPSANMPEYLSNQAPDMTDVGSLKEPNLELIASLEPDLIIANGRTEGLVQELEKIAPVFVFSLAEGDQWESFVAINLALASIVDKADQAQASIEDIAEKADILAAYNTENPASNMILMLNEGAMSAFGPGSRYSLFFDRLGFNTVDGQIEVGQHGQEISFEGVLALNPDRIFYLDRTKAIGGDQEANPILSDNPLIKESAAGQTGQIYPLASDIWYLAGDGLSGMEMKLDELIVHLGIQDSAD